MTSIANMKRPALVVETLETAFPVVDPGVLPSGHRVLVQIKNAARKTQAGLHIVEDVVSAEFDNTQVAKVIALGPVAYKSRESLDGWPEGPWCKPGDFIRMPKHTNNQNTWSVQTQGGDQVTFTCIDDLSVIGVQEDPFYVKAFL